MKKIVVVALAFALLTLLFAVAPVLAESPKKLDVTADISGTKSTPGYEVRDNNGEVRHVYDMEWKGNVVLNVPGRDPLVGTFRNSIDGMRIMNPADGVDHSNAGFGVWHFSEVWTFEGGTFEGTSQVKTYASGWTNFAGRIVLHGTGVFEGWVIWMENSIPPPPPTYRGQLLIP